MAKYNYRDDECCSVNFNKYVLHIFNILFVVTGLGILYIALWTILDKFQYFTLLTTVTYPVLTYFLLAAGGLVLLVATLGFFAGCGENRPLILLYIFLLVFIFLVDVMVGVLGFIYQESVHNDLENNLNHTFVTQYKIDSDKTVVIDFIQEKFQCCGAVSFSDWDNSKWKVQNPINKVPDSCCKTIKSNCGKRDHPSNINYGGCLKKMEDDLRNHISIVSLVSLGICVIQIFGVAYACLLYIKLRDISEEI